MSATLPFAETEITGTIAARFQCVVAGLPDQLAVLANDGAFSYRAIDHIAERVARAIGGQQLPNSGPIAILLPQSAQTLAALLGCLKAGYSFLVLPPTFPLPRLRAIWADARSPLLLTDSHHWQQALAIATTPAQCLNLEQLAASKPASTSNATTTSDASALAALFYTSGTTGEPKGVMWSQTLVLHTARQNQMLYGLTPQDRIAILTSFGFGAAMTLGFAALLNGATVCLVDEHLNDPSALLCQLQQQTVTVLGLPPVGLLRQIMDMLEHGSATGGGLDRELLALRLVLLGGQPLRRQDVMRFYHCFGEQVMLRYRLAGSETMLMCDLPITPQTVYPGDDVPVGYAAPDKEILLLDEDRQPVKLGEIGEIVVRSRYLAAGYWQAPMLTAATFLVDPTDADQRLCFTGDMARMTPEGLLFHLGRKDNMVKVRGYRVQLEAVEAALIRLNAIDEAVVVAHATRNGEQQLLAYYTSKANPPPTTTALRQALLAHLPAFMLPARFIALASLPRNATGKLDRAALPPPGAERPALGTPFVAPRSEQEQQIADLWAELLAVDEVGVDDNFFELGGDSISLLRISTLLSQRFGYTIPTRYYTMPTIRYLAQGLTTATADLPATMPTEAAPHAPQRVDRKQPQVLPYREGLYPPTRLGKAFVQRGPTYAGLKLPYALGTALQRTLVQQHLIRQHFFPKQCELLGQALWDVGLAPQAEAITVNLMANSWKGWRGQALQAPPTFARWVAIKGNEHLMAGLARGNGLIVVFTHQALITNLTRHVLAAHDIQQVPVIAASRPGADDVSMAVRGFRHGQEGLALLRRGQAILIAGEGREGTDPVRISLYGRRLPLPRGFAVLAQISQAAVVAAFSSMNTTGHITLEFVPLPTPDPTAAVEDWVEQYGAQLTARWPRLLSMTGWPRLAYLATLPVQQKNYVPIKV